MGNTAATPEAAADRREPEPRPTAEPRPAKAQRNISTGKPARSRRTGGAAESAGGHRKTTSLPGTMRYFLTKPTSNGTPELGEEMPDETPGADRGRSQGRSEFRNDRGMDAPKRTGGRGVTVIGKESRRPAVGGFHTMIIWLHCTE